ncbi:alpha-1,6-mannosyl-glycoprotein 2-beta-N-acetylglucosaminyltransferase-like [Actinia tenebrosa]|uniref:Alpha-1,6-mannosyl-glycoprotein 2-beta-N-acetylglucosaminyltransferase n=1 Tax=Actinia tenebrosa TaxID=6105 RepID=A0A6P8I9D2_ACTTE|nr:alpha-1,6-mannosyl-glycoprotein 2-beta-N-acetylglucosaminyltransferase-like [Actinia tenebrosa]
MFRTLKRLLPGRGMLAFRYRGTIIRTSAFKLLFLAVLTISMVMFMRLQGLFLAMPVQNEDKQFGSVLPKQHPKHRINYIPLPTDLLSSPRTSEFTTNNFLAARTSKKHVALPTPNLILPSLGDKKGTEPPIDIEKVRKIIQNINSQERIQNFEKFPSPLNENSMIIIIQVHNRPDYFSHLLRSLSAVSGIQDGLLVISHDFYSDFINSLVDAINFCKVLQIFFPYSMQLYPHEFPGTDPKDCPRDATRTRAKEIGCNNADHPDKYGHYREAKFTMTKHHWWWKANMVFDGLNITKNYNGPVVFLEEDHYASPDFYHVLKKLYETKLKDSNCDGGCDILTLGTYTLTPNYKTAGENVVELQKWRSVRHNMGMAFDRNTWESIKDCKQLFCAYDDYNWDWTLMRISQTCLRKPLKALVMKTPRVFHIGECGIHHKKKECNPDQTVSKFNSIIQDNADSFFPASLKVEHKFGEVSSSQPNGGWGDTRDHDLCLSFVKT